MSSVFDFEKEPTFLGGRATLSRRKVHPSDFASEALVRSIRVICVQKKKKGSYILYAPTAFEMLVPPSSDHEERGIHFISVKQSLKFSRKFRLKSQARGLEGWLFVKNFRENFRDRQKVG